MPERCEPQAVNFPPTRWLIFASSPESDWCFLESMIISYTCRGEALNVIVCLRVLVRTLFFRIYISRDQFSVVVWLMVETGELASSEAPKTFWSLANPSRGNFPSAWNLARQWLRSWRPAASTGSIVVKWNCGKDGQHCGQPLRLQWALLISIPFQPSLGSFKRF